MCRLLLKPDCSLGAEGREDLEKRATTTQSGPRPPDNPQGPLSGQPGPSETSFNSLGPHEDDNPPEKT